MTMAMLTKIGVMCGAVGAVGGTAWGVGYGAWQALDTLEVRPALIRELRAQDAVLTRSIGEVRTNTQKALDQLAQSVGKLSDSLNIQDYKVLVVKYNDGTITPQEQVLLCAIARDLKISAPGCL
jgi:hypothetical protein